MSYQLVQFFHLGNEETGSKERLSLPTLPSREARAVIVLVRLPCVTWQKWESQRESGAGHWGKLMICLLGTELGAIAFANAEVSLLCVRRRKARAVSSIALWRAVACCYVKQTQTRKGMPTNRLPTLTLLPSGERLTASLPPLPLGVKSMPLAECRLNDPDENLSWNQCTTSLGLSQERALGIATQRSILAWHGAMFFNHQERKGIQETGPAVTRKWGFPFFWLVLWI